MPKTISPSLRVYAVFFIYSLMLGGIFPRLGDLQQKMGIGESALGMALMGAALGTQVSLMFAGGLLERLGYRKALILSIPLLGFAEAAATLAPDPVTFFMCLFVMGLAIGAIEIIVNVEADRTEHLLGRRIMNRSHAFWSFGFFAAGMVGAVATQLSIHPTVHLLGLAVVTSIAIVLVLRSFEPAPARIVEEGSGPKFVRPSAGILLMVVFTLSAMLLEGAGIDWSVIFMRDSFDATPFVNGLALAIGALTQGVVRFFADGFVERLGPVRVARLMIGMLGIGVVVVTTAINPYVALLGFGLMGVGTSGIFPLAMSAAAQRTDRPAAVNVSALAQLSFITFLVGPPVLGFVAEHFGIRTSFGIGIPLVIISWFTVHTLVPAKGKTS